MRPPLHEFCHPLVVPLCRVETPRVVCGCTNLPSPKSCSGDNVSWGYSKTWDFRLPAMNWCGERFCGERFNVMDDVLEEYGRFFYFGECEAGNLQLCAWRCSSHNVIGYPDRSRRHKTQKQKRKSERPERNRLVSYIYFQVAKKEPLLCTTR